MALISEVKRLFTETDLKKISIKIEDNQLVIESTEQKEQPTIELPIEIFTVIKNHGRIDEVRMINLNIKTSDQDNHILKINLVEDKNLKISFNKVTLPGRIEIVNSELCEIKFFNKCLIRSMEFKGSGSETGQTPVKNLQNLIIKDSVFEKGISFTSVDLSGVSVESSYLGMATTSMGGLERSLVVQNKSRIDTLKFEKSFIGNIGVSNSTVQKLSVENCGFVINENKATGIIVHDDATVEDMALHKVGHTTPDNIAREAKKNTKFQGTIGQLILKNTPDKEESTVNKSQIKNLVICESEIDSINLSVSSMESALLSNTSMKELALTGDFAENKKMEFSSLKITGLSFQKFNNYGKIDFISVDPHPDPDRKCWMKIIKSDLGKTSFVACKLDEFQIEFSTSRLGQITLAHTHFPTERKNFFAHVTSTGKEENKEKVLKKTGDMISLFDQLALLHAANNDHYHAHRYKAHKLNFLLKQLRVKEKNAKERADYISLMMNDVTSQFGDNLWRITWVTVSLNILFLLVYILSLRYFEFDASVAGLRMFGDLASHYFEFVNPLHDSDFLVKSYEITNNGWSRFVDSLFRLVNAYLIYQFIQAFRKLGSRSNDIK